MPVNERTRVASSCNSWPAFVPIMFECTVLFAGLATVAAMFLFNGLPNLTRRVFDPALTNNRFAIWIGSPLPVEEDDDDAKAKMAKFKRFDEKEAQQLLQQVGASQVKSTFAEGWF